MPGQLLPAGGGGGRRVDHRPMGGHDPLRGACRPDGAGDATGSRAVVCR